jgi:putative Mn2+ efflux pump MntP
MDAFSICVGFGCCNKTCSNKSAFKLAFFTGLFQFVMPLAGWFIGNLIDKFINNFGPWAAFIILSGIGIKMIVESFTKKEECNDKDISKGKELLIACFATSIDAFIAGLSLGILKLPLLISTTIIGTITFILSLIGVYLGKFIGMIIGRWSEVLGGIILITIGLKLLLIK